MNKKFTDLQIDLHWLFDDHGFVIDSYTESHFMCNVELWLKSNMLNICIWDDRGTKLFIDISSITEPKKLYGLELVLALLQKIPLTGYDSDIHVMIHLLRDNFEIITKLFQNDYYIETKERLKQLGNERAKLLYPEAYSQKKG